MARLASVQSGLSVVSSIWKSIWIQDSHPHQVDKHPNSYIESTAKLQVSKLLLRRFTVRQSHTWKETMLEKQETLTKAMKKHSWNKSDNFLISISKLMEEQLIYQNLMMLKKIAYKEVWKFMVRIKILHFLSKHTKRILMKIVGKYLWKSQSIKFSMTSSMLWPKWLITSSHLKIQAKNLD